ncbi:hypothetical protein BB561_001030 [Smittium simulii]|uniref:CUE domain-containing protein n=1 Tax=Smittium simulii TaxID=133385 RepID=A0A2T9YWG1_9FUNG|nr:hypothetical protein BB561_001030 [Smittium simulii]
MRFLTNSQTAIPRNPTHNGGPVLHPVNEQQLQELQIIFPNISPEAIRYDLSKTGSLETTTENILRLGTSLPRPPIENHPLNQASQNTATAINNAGSNFQSNSSQSNLDIVSKFNLNNFDDTSEPLEKPEHEWAEDPALRAEKLKKQKEYMILAARKKFLEKESKQLE